MATTARIRITRVIEPAELGRQILPKMTNLGQAMGARMQRIVPKRTWALHDTVTMGVEQRGAKVVLEVGAGSDRVGYALAVERGTSKMAAQPFIRPAFAQTTGKDLLYSGNGITQHGVVAFSSRRQRVRARGQR